MSARSLSIRIVATGARSAVGDSAPMTAAAARGGLAGFSFHPYLVDKSGKPMNTARAPYVPIELAGAPRSLALAAPAACEALAGIPPGRVRTLPVFLALPPDRPGLAAGYAASVVNGLRERLVDVAPLGDVVLTATGHAGGLACLAAAQEALTSGAADLCLVGGVDSYLEPETMEWLDDEGLLLSQANRWGFVPGEGAGFSLLASESAAVRLGAADLGRVLTVATAIEPHHARSGGVCVGKGLAAAMRGALDAAPGRVDQLLGDLNGTRYRADEYGFAITRLGGRLGGLATTALSSSWGDIGAATVPLLVSFVVRTALRGFPKGPRTLIWASSEGGARGAAVVDAPPLRVDP